MTKQSHTPRPWEVGQAGVGVAAVYALDKRRREPICIFGIPSPNDEGWDEFKDAPDHARLIAAAPELLEMLKMARECIAYCRRAHKDIQTGEGIPVESLIDTVISKATGES